MMVPVSIRPSRSTRLRTLACTASSTTRLRSYFKSSLDSHLFDLLWNKYWVSTLSSSKIVASAEYIAGQVKDLVEKLEQVEGSISHAGRLGGLFVMSERKKQNLTQLSKISQDGCKIATEQIQSMLSQTLKETLFNSA